MLYSSNAEKVDGGLNIGVKAEKKRSALDFILGTPPAAAAKELTEYTVRIEQRSGTEGQLVKKSGRMS